MNVYSVRGSVCKVWGVMVCVFMVLQLPRLPGGDKRSKPNFTSQHGLVKLCGLLCFFLNPYADTMQCVTVKMNFILLLAHQVLRINPHVQSRPCHRLDNTTVVRAQFSEQWSQ